MPGGEILIIGGGLAGVEAAWQAVRLGVKVTLAEMKPRRFSPAHRSADLAELVCSNSLRSKRLDTASGLLKEEMRRLGSLVIRVAEETSVPAGSSLAVDRQAFSRRVTSLIEEAGVSIIREEITRIPVEPETVVVSTGPLPSAAIAAAIEDLTGSGTMYFYDAIAPIVAADSVDYSKTFWASRYDRGGPDYLNCPMDETTYYRFVQEVRNAEKVSGRDFEGIPAFEGCMPIEDLAARGLETLAHGPMRPVGLVDPRTGRLPHAVVQLRKDNVSGSMLNMVGFQTRMTWSEQKRVFRLIPGLERAHFYRYGSIHRNAFLNAPRLFLPTFQLKKDPRIFFAGQITGVEGYVESAASGLIVGCNAARRALGLPALFPPVTTAIGALLSYVVRADPDDFQPMRVNFGLLPPLDIRSGRSRKARRSAWAARALQDLDTWIEEAGLQDSGCPGAPSL